MLRATAKMVSVIFHPLLILTYMLLLLLMVNPYLFGSRDPKHQGVLVLSVFFTSFLIPSIAIVMMKALDMISSVALPDRQERIGPFLATAIFYLWLYYNLLKSQAIPPAFTLFALGTVIGLFAAFLINLFYKISLHSLGMGGLTGMVAISMWLFSNDTFSLGDWRISTNIILLLVIMLSGIVGSSRLILRAHSSSEIYTGYALGLLSQFVALKWLI